MQSVSASLFWNRDMHIYVVNVRILLFFKDYCVRMKRSVWSGSCKLLNQRKCVSTGNLFLGLVKYVSGWGSRGWFVFYLGNLCAWVSVKMKYIGLITVRLYYIFLANTLFRLAKTLVITFVLTSYFRPCLSLDISFRTEIFLCFLSHAWCMRVW